MVNTVTAVNVNDSLVNLNQGPSQLGTGDEVMNTGGAISDFTKGLLAEFNQIDNLRNQVAMPFANGEITPGKLMERQKEMEEFVTETTLVSKEAGLVAKTIDTLVTKTQ